MNLSSAAEPYSSCHFGGGQCGRSAGMNRAKTARPDANGAFAFKPTPTGDYKIVVVDERDIGEISSSGNLGFYEPDAKKIKVHANDSLTIDLKQP